MTGPSIVLPPQTPSKPSQQGAARVGTQAARRFTDTVFDQHRHPTLFPRGRPWCGQREYAATPDMGHQPGFISADLQPGEYVYSIVDGSGNRFQSAEDRAASLASAWNAPWLPLAKYAKFNYHRQSVTWEYVRMEADELRSLDNYYEAAAKLAGENDVIEYGKLPGFRIRQMIGMPTTLHRIAQAARAGDPWLLGFVNTPNEELAKCLNKKVRFLGGDRNAQISDSQYVVTDIPVPQGKVTPEQVLATPQADLAKMIAEAVAGALAVRDAQDAAKKQADKEKMAALRAKRTKGSAA